MDDLAILFDRYVEMIYGVCLYYLKNGDDARDASMELYHHIRRKIRNQYITNFKPWLHVTTKNYCLGILRKGKKNLTLSYDPTVMHLSEDLHPIDDHQDPKLDHERLKTCLKNLPEAQQKAIYSFYYEQQSYEDIAKKSGITLNKVRSYMQNGRRNLKNCLELHHGK